MLPSHGAGAGSLQGKGDAVLISDCGERKSRKDTQENMRPVSLHRHVICTSAVLEMLSQPKTELCIPQTKHTA